MNLKKMWELVFSYTPPKEYHFSLPNTEETQTNFLDEENAPDNATKIFPSLKVNREFLQTQYNTMINSDIVIRDFTLNARGKQYNALIMYIDGMVNSQIMDDFVLKPLMLRNKNNLFESSQNKVISEAVTNNITVRKVKKFDLPSYLTSCLLPQNSIKEIKDFKDASNGINARKLCSFC